MRYGFVFAWFLYLFELSPPTRYCLDINIDITFKHLGDTDPEQVTLDGDIGKTLNTCWYIIPCCILIKPTVAVKLELKLLLTKKQKLIRSCWATLWTSYDMIWFFLGPLLSVTLLFM